MIASVTPNPAYDRTVYIEKLLPNDTNRILKVELDAGGKGVNASRMLRELGTETVALGFLGGRTGSFISHVLDIEGIECDFVQVAEETRTNISIQETSGAPPTMLDEPGPHIMVEDVDALEAKVRAVAGRSDMVTMGGSLPPGAPDDLYRTLVKAVQDSGARAILDSEGQPMVLGMQAAPFMIKPNRDEVRRLVGVDIQSLDDSVRAMNMLAETGVKLVVISMGAKGAVAMYQGEVWHAIPPEVKVISTIGSGDSMVAGIAHIISRGGNLSDALRWGTAAGAATAMTNGTEIGRREDVLRLLDSVRIERIDA